MLMAVKRRSLNEILEESEAMRDAKTFGDACEVLLRDPTPAKGRKFEELLVAVLPSIAETEIRRAWRWSQVPEAQKAEVAPSMTGADTGIDILAERSDGRLIAIQAKCTARTRRTLSRSAGRFAGISEVGALPAHGLPSESCRATGLPQYGTTALWQKRRRTLRKDWRVNQK